MPPPFNPPPISTDPLVSIIIPVYNGARFLAEAIDSALAQTYRNIEVIVIDDGSDDAGATRAIVQRYANRVSYVYKRNGGVSTALNRGMEVMRGTFFSWLSHDDLYLPDKIEAQIAAWREFGRPCVVVSRWELIEEDGRLHCNQPPPLDRFDLTSQPLEALLHGMLNGCAMLIPRSAFPDNGFDPGLPRTQDNHMWFRLLWTIPFIHCDRLGTRNRVHKDQGSRDPLMMDDAGLLFSHIFDSLSPQAIAGYEGSELRSLWRFFNENLCPYPGLRPYLWWRIEEATRREPFTLALLSSGPAEVLASQLHALHARPLRPVQLLILDLGITGERRKVEAALALWGRSSITAPASQTIAGFLQSIAASADTNLIMTALTVPDADDLRDALLALACTDSPAARRRDQPPTVFPLDRHIFSREAIRAQADHLAAGGTGFTGPIIEYPLAGADKDAHAPKPVPALPSRQVTGIRPDSAVLEKWRDGLRRDLPTILIIGRTDTPLARTHLVAEINQRQRHANVLSATLCKEGAPSIKLTWEAADASERLDFALPQTMGLLLRALQYLGVSSLQIHDVRGLEGVVSALLDTLMIPMDAALPDRSTIPVETLLRQCRHLRATSRELSALIRHKYVGLSVEYDPLTARYPLEQRGVYPFFLRSGEPLRVLVFGDTGLEGGSAIMAESIQIVQRRGLPIVFHALGPIEGLSAGSSMMPTLHNHPAEDMSTVWNGVSSIVPHIAWLPYQTPRDWTWELDLAMWAMLPVAGSALGSMVERCTGRRHTWLLPPGTTAEEWVRFLLQRRERTIDLPVSFG